LALPALLGTAVAVFVEIDRRPVRLCRQWEREARAAQGDALRSTIQSLDAYGAFGLPALVRLLDCEQESTTRAARDALAARLRRASPGGTSTDRAAAIQIAEELRYLVAGRGAPVSPAAADVALELLEAVGRLGRSNDFDADLRDRFVQTCDDVLRLAPSTRTPPLESLVERSRAPRSVFPPLPAPIPASPAGPDKAKDDDLASDVPGKLQMPVAAEPVPPPPPLVGNDAATSQTTAANTAARINPIREPVVDSQVRQAAASTTIASLVPSLPAEVLRGDAWGLFELLHDAEAPLAEKELRRRGFSAREIDLGKHLADPNVDERRRYAKLLTSLGGIDVKPWLLRLSRDDDEDIRLTVTAIMATTNDPELLARVRTMSLDDPSEDVRATALRAADGQTLRR
jgi:hypothetical protein